jgi:hypothetical protein
MLQYFLTLFLCLFDISWHLLVLLVLNVGIFLALVALVVHPCITGTGGILGPVAVSNIIAIFVRTLIIKRFVFSIKRFAFSESTNNR